METILAVAFGRVVAVQRGEADSLTEAAEHIFGYIQGNWLFAQTVLSMKKITLLGSALYTAKALKFTVLIF